MYPILSSFVCITVPLLLVVNGVFHIYVYRIVFHHNDLSMWSNHCYQESKNALIEVSVTRHDFFLVSCICVQEIFSLFAGPQSFYTVRTGERVEAEFYQDNGGLF